VGALCLIVLGACENWALNHPRRHCPAGSTNGSVRNRQRANGRWPFPVYKLEGRTLREIHPADEYVAGIVDALQRARDERIRCKVIFAIMVHSVDHVWVSTGLIRGPFDAGGDAVNLVRERGVWQVDSVGQWIS
jgi:hypothetical protein